MSEASNNPQQGDIRFRIPGVAYDNPEDDLYPVDEDDKKAVVGWTVAAFNDARGTRSELEDRWRKYYRMYRSYAGKRNPGDWRSRVWIPLAFYVVETIVPRLVAQLPKLTVEPVGPEDVEGAKQMEFLLDYVTEESDLYLELVKAFRSALIYGTGILKTCYDEKFATSFEPVMEDMMTQMPVGMDDMDGNPMMQSVPMTDPQTGQPMQQPTGEMKRTKVLKYAGPAAEAVDIFNFFVSPEADDIDTASYVCHQVFRTRDHVEKMAQKGHYKIPPDMDWEQFTSSDSWGNPAQERLGEIGLGGGANQQSAKGTKLIEIREFWTDDLVITTAGDRILLRVERNPYGHNEKPFVRILDHMVQHEFWGIGELEPLEGVQDTINSLWNSRIDNVKLVLNQMFAVSVDYLEDTNDLKIRPGGIIRLREGIPIDQAIKPLDLGEVTQSSYTEAAEMERLSEKISGVSAYQMGTDSPALNRTATGVALISEQGNTRFAHKVRISELTGLRKLARHFGSIIQQFMPENFVVRLQGPAGQFLFQTIDQASIAGAFDYSIEAESASQTESIRREQTLSLFSYLVQMPEVNRAKLIEDVLEVFGRKDTGSYLNLAVLMQQQMMEQQQMAMMQQGVIPPMEQMAALPPGEGPDASQPPAGEPSGESGGATPPAY